jgi:hypothetical protein
LQTGLAYVDHPATAGYYGYVVYAYDGAGNRSAASSKLTVKAVN